MWGMAKKVIVSIVDDLDGETAADETVEFAIDGVSYEVDLSSNNAQKLRDDLQKWVDAARRVGGKRKPRSAIFHRESTGGEDTAAMRAWARGNGYELANRGRIPFNVIDAYRAAH
jgi:alpha-L-fucosidase